MGKCKTRGIQTDLGTFRHNQVYSKPFVNLAYSEPCYIQNLDIFKTRNIFRTLVYSEPQYTENSVYWHIENPMIIQPSAMSNIYDEAFCENG